MQFHRHHGGNVRLSHDRTVAWRTSGFANGITFSDKPLEPNEIFLIEIDENENGWSGHIRLGLSQIDPNDRPPLPLYALPDLNHTGSAWVFAITKNKSRIYDGINGEYSLPARSQPIYSTFAHLPLLPFQPSLLVQLPTDVGSRLGVFYRVAENGSGQMHLVMNGEDKGPVVVDLPLHLGKLYALVDIYGTTKQVRIIPVYSKVSSLQSLCRDCIIKRVDRSQIASLPLPVRLKRNFLDFKMFTGTTEDLFD